MANYDNIFTDDVKSAIQNSMLSPITKPKGKQFFIDKDEFIQQIDFNNGIERENFKNYFVVKRIDNQFKIVRIQEVQ